MLKNKILSYIISISFILCAMLSCIHFYCFNRPFYASQHRNIQLYGKSINEYIGISLDDLDKLTDFTLDYLMDEDATLDIQLTVNGNTREIYTDDEKAHMIDVRSLNLIAYKLQIFTTFVFVVSSLVYFILKFDINTFKNIYLNCLKYLSIFIVLIGTYILIDFDSFWTNFHHIFFSSNDLWLLDLRSDILIMIVPPEFFNHLVTYIVVTFTVIIVASAFIVKRIVKND